MAFLPTIAIAGEPWIGVSTGSPIFGCGLLTEAGQGLPVGKITDNVSILSGRNLRYGIDFNHSPKASGGFVSTISVGLFQYSLFKPHGLGIFVDPVTIKSSAIILEAETGYQKRLNYGATYLFSATASLGVQLSYASISIKSKVLNIQESLSSLSPYVQFKLNRDFGHAKSVSPWVSARFSTHNYKEISAGISWKF